mmetsp:Transcript_14060/g.20087  ORF Transcript_14060/g.20087 Transcript_14060/m.20087 type:complete len:187 (+) Transcript_14060:39-599(+)
MVLLLNAISKVFTILAPLLFVFQSQSCSAFSVANHLNSYGSIASKTRRKYALQNYKITTSTSSSPTKLFAIEAATVQSLQGDHEEEGIRLANSLASYLDNEWMPQEVHGRMGDVVKDIYIECRLNGDDDIMSIMVKTSETLEKRWKEFDADAFVNAWDIGNYVADYLTQRAGIETCTCSTPIEGDT